MNRGLSLGDARRCVCLCDTTGRPLRAVIHDVHAVTATQVRWLGHRLVAELTIDVDADHSVQAGHEITIATRQHLSETVAHIDESTSTSTPPRRRTHRASSSPEPPVRVEAGTAVWRSGIGRESQAAEELGVEGDDDGRQAHQDGADGG